MPMLPPDLPTWPGAAPRYTEEQMRRRCFWEMFWIIVHAIASVIAAFSIATILWCYAMNMYAEKLR
jgi:hypothetical protein